MKVLMGYLQRLFLCQWNDTRWVKRRTWNHRGRPYTILLFNKQSTSTNNPTESLFNGQSTSHTAMSSASYCFILQLITQPWYLSILRQASEAPQLYPHEVVKGKITAICQLWRNQQRQLTLRLHLCHIEKDYCRKSSPVANFISCTLLLRITDHV